jgi:hypothetical protein
MPKEKERLYPPPTREFQQALMESMREVSARFRAEDSQLVETLLEMVALVATHTVSKEAFLEDCGKYYDMVLQNRNWQEKQS